MTHNPLHRQADAYSYLRYIKYVPSCMEQDFSFYLYDPTNINWHCQLSNEWYWLANKKQYKYCSPK